MNVLVIFIICFFFIEGFGYVYRNASRLKRTVRRCKVTEYACESGDCIDENSLCDGIADCPDGSDETISCSSMVCPVYLFRCKYGACIDPDLRCNGVNDCKDNSDENGCERKPVKRSPIISNPEPGILPKNSCFLPQHPKNGKWIALHSLTAQPGDIVEMNTVIAFSCEANYKLTPYVTLSLCLPDWTILPKCLNTCPPLLPPQGISVSCNINGVATTCDNPAEGTIATVTCNNSFSYNPNPLITCRDGIWNHALPTCVLKTCSSLIPTKQMQVSCTNKGESSSCRDPIEGTIATVTCANYYEDSPITNRKLIHCVDGTWDNSLPNCQPKTCSSLIPTKQMQVSCTNKGESSSCRDPIEGTIATVTCANFYEDLSITNKKLRHCVDGAWDYPLPNCQPICGKTLTVGEELIINSNKTTQGLYPWHVGIYKNKQYICGGSIITPKIIISAAHCFGGEVLAKSYAVGAGKYYRQYDDLRDQGAQFSKVSQIIKHKNFNNGIPYMAFDFALLVLTNPFHLSKYVLPVCLENGDDYTVNEMTKGIAMGWGRLDKLQYFDLEYKTTKTCDIPEQIKIYYIPYAPDKLCFKSQGPSICAGYSGGGLVVRSNDGRYILRGIISTGPRDDNLGCISNQTTLFTSIEYHKQQIMQLMNKLRE